MIETLDQDFAAHVRGFLDMLAREHIDVAIVNARRSPLEQRAYFAQGRETLAQVNALRSTAGLSPITAKENGHTVTDTLHSKHVEGKAIDVVPLDASGRVWWGAPESLYRKIGLIGETAGLDWVGGGSGKTWGKGWDIGHFEPPGPGIGLIAGGWFAVTLCFVAALWAIKRGLGRGARIRLERRASTPIPLTCRAEEYR